jgi:hypothetical protein
MLGGGDVIAHDYNSSPLYDLAPYSYANTQTAVPYGMHRDGTHYPFHTDDAYVPTFPQLTTLTTYPESGPLQSAVSLQGVNTMFPTGMLFLFVSTESIIKP